MKAFKKVASKVADKVNLKALFLYGTLFSALGFSISGHDPHKEGHVQFSSALERTPNTVQLSTVPKPLDAKAAAQKKAPPAAAAVTSTGSEASIAATSAAIEPSESEVPASAVADISVAASTATPSVSTVVVNASGSVRGEATRGNAPAETRSAPGRTTSQNSNPANFREYN